jgi:hypothetical protein
LAQETTATKENATMQTSTTSKPSPRAYTLSHRLASAALSASIGAGRACGLLPKGTDFFVEPALSPRLDAWKTTDHAWVNLHAVLGKVELVVSLPR